MILRAPDKNLKMTSFVEKGRSIYILLLFYFLFVVNGKSWTNGIIWLFFVFFISIRSHRFIYVFIFSLLWL